MGKWLSIIIGLILAALGLAGIIRWWEEGVMELLRSGIVLAAFLIGIGAIIFGLGELRTPTEIPPVSPPPAEEKPSSSE
jgi:hypothetical protein